MLEHELQHELQRDLAKYKTLVRLVATTGFACILYRGGEISHVTTVAKANKSRLTIRGLVDGQQYIVREQPGGWFITPEKSHRVKKAGMSAEAFSRLYRSRKPLDASTAREIAANLAAIDRAK